MDLGLCPSEGEGRRNKASASVQPDDANLHVSSIPSMDLAPRPSRKDRGRKRSLQLSSQMMQMFIVVDGRMRDSGPDLLEVVWYVHDSVQLPGFKSCMQILVNHVIALSAFSCLFGSKAQL